MPDFSINYEPVIPDKNNSLPTIHHVGLKRNPPVKKRSMHLHPDYLEIVFFRKGRGTCIVGKQLLKFGDGDILIYNCNTLHEEKYASGQEFEQYVCAISNLQISGLKENQLIRHDAYPLLHTQDHQIAIETLFRLLIQETLSEHTNKEETCQHLACALVSIVKELISSSINEQTVEKSNLGTQIADYINTHFHEDISLETIANHFHISHYHASHVFKQEFDTSIVQYIIGRRIGEAQTLLTYSSFPIGQIAKIVGYEDQNYFNIVFRKHTGFSPTAFRNQFLSQSKM